MPRRHAKTCEHCGAEFLAWRSSGRYCSNTCSVRDNPKPQNQNKYAITRELLELAERETPYGGSRLKFVSERVGCDPATVSYRARAMGFVLERRPRQKNYHTTTHVERRYVYSIGCVICGERRAVDAAHLIPRAEGGTGMVGNIVPLCPTHHRVYDRATLTDNELEKLVAFLYDKFNLREVFDNAKASGLQIGLEENSVRGLLEENG